MFNASPGDIALREFADARGSKPLRFTVTEVTPRTIVCGPWEFDRRTGAEIDVELGWGPHFGRTGSFLVGIERADGNTVNAIQTHTNKFIDPFNPDPSKIDIRDIAHAGSNQCRFTGHTRRHWSVTAHQLLVAWLLPREFKPWGLVHDGSEAFIVDLPSPIKRHPDMRVFREVDTGLQRAIGTRYRLPWPMPPEVKEADKVAMVAEAKVLLHGVDQWETWPELQKLDSSRAEKFWLLRYPVPSWLVKHIYLYEFKKLFGTLDPD
jgi:uncharacterized protein